MNPLEELIKKRINASGPISFAEFMELALYHPDHGYYMSDKQKIGKAGDFFTSPHVSSLFGRTIGKFIEKSFTDGTIKIIEFGAGSGWLAKDITDHLEHSQRSYEYFIIEVSGSMINDQKRLLKDKPQINWVNSLEDLNKDNYFILANELLDALPVHRVTKENGKIMEINVGLKNDTLTNIHADPRPEIIKFLKNDPEFEQNVIEGEISPGAVAWLQNVFEKMTKGTALIIDYGYTNRELPHYPSGTVNCFFEHTNTGDPYINIGQQDITSYVNFSPLIRFAQDNGMNYKLDPQTNFLIENGILEEQQRISSTMNALDQFKLSMSVKTLVMPNAMGERFKCLTIEKLAT